MNNKTLTIAFVGGGNMASAMITGLLRDGHAPASVRVAEPDAERRAALQAIDPGLQLSQDNQRAVSGANLVVLAVKPQLMAEVAGALRLETSQTVVSVAAGIGLASLAGWFADGQPCIRVMPNQPALVGAGMSVLCAGDSVSNEGRNQADYLLAAAGETAWVEEESLMDAVTAVSGSGPAYFYLFIELLEAGAKDMGIPPDIARQLAIQTAYGAGLTAREGSEAPAALRRRVSSPGGTTQAAIEAFEAGGLDRLLKDALEAARRRSEELGRDAS